MAFLLRIQFATEFNRAEGFRSKGLAAAAKFILQKAIIKACVMRHNDLLIESLLGIAPVLGSAASPWSGLGLPTSPSICNSIGKSNLSLGGTSCGWFEMLEVSVLDDKPDFLEVAGDLEGLEDAGDLELLEEAREPEPPGELVFLLLVNILELGSVQKY